MKKMSKKKNFFSIFTVLFLSNLIFICLPVRADEITELQKKIEAKQLEIKKLEEQKKLYQKKIDSLEKAALTLKNKISLINNRIYKTKTEIKETESKIEEKNLSIERIQLSINDQKKKIDNNKKNLARLLQIINVYDNKSPLEIILLNRSVSDFFAQIKYLKDIQSALQGSLKKIKIVKETLELQEKELREAKENLLDLRDSLTKKKNDLLLEKRGKQNLLKETQGAEWKYQSLLAAAIREHRLIEQEIKKTEAEIREKILNKKLTDSDLQTNVPPILSWPFPEHHITCYFHDPDYPFKKILGPHSGIDIRARQGTPIRSAASGYVAKVRNAGLGGYSYILIVHGGNLSTLYGHVSKIYVEKGERVKRGDIIGLSGGMPGTPGAGRFSTGPHLHFEVRLNGTPVNPLEYLVK